MRAAAMACLLGAAACASAGGPQGPPGTVAGLGVAGVWVFDLTGETPIRGTVVLDSDDSFVVRCGDDGPTGTSPRPLTQRAGAIEFDGCGGVFQVRRLDDGRVVADVTWSEQRPYTGQGSCIEKHVYEDGRWRCLRYEKVTRYRDQTVQAQVELTRVSSTMRSTPSTVRSMSAVVAR